MNRPLLLGVLCALLVTAPLSATRIRRLSASDLASQASAVIAIEVLDATVRIGRGDLPWTDYQVRVVEVVRGEHTVGDLLTLPFAGGRAGGIDAGFEGVPRLERGGRYLVYLDDAPGRPVPIVGWEQGLVRLDRTEAAGAPGHSGSCTCGGFAATPVRFEIEHLDRPDFAAAAAAEFERWNRYIDVFDARPGDGAAGPNGTNEIAFFTSAESFAKYGISLNRNIFAITYMSPLVANGDFDGCPKPPQTVCGTFTETDVIMNAEFVRGFTPDGPVDFTDRGPALYGATAAHELGHALGFHHNVNNISVMNLYEDFAARYIAASDAAEARIAYASRMQSVTDLAAYPFAFDASLTDYAATTPVEVMTTRVAPGGTITVRNFGFENVGTNAVTGVELRLYLSSDADVTTSDFLLGTIDIAGVVESGAFFDDLGAGRTFTLSRDVPDGTYFVGAMATFDGGSADSIAYNNAWVAPQTVTIAPVLRRRAVRK